MTFASVRQRTGIVVGVLLAVLVVPFAAPIGLAHACGCGVYSPGDGGTAAVSSETALVRTAGNRTEDVYLSLSVDSSVRTGALLFPVPDKHATVSAGPRHLFDDLAALTRRLPDPAPAAGGNRAGAPAPGVTVENRQQIGPLDVVTLSSGDPGALTLWLQHNGFAAKPALTTAAAPYTRAGWAFVAVRLRPAAATTTRLDGQLDPLHLHFASKETVYPMRLSAMATEPERVTVYTLAPHELALDTTDPGMDRVWASHVPASGGADLAAVTAGGTTYLTRFDGTLTPATITDDFHFRTTVDDPTAATTGTGTITDGPPSGVVPADGYGYAAPSPSSRSSSAEITVVVIGILAVLVLLGTAIMIQQHRGAPPRR